MFLPGQSPPRVLVPKTTIRRGPQTLTDVFGITCSYLWYRQLQSVHLLPRYADDSRTTQDIPLSRTAWTTAYGRIVRNGLRTQKTLWRLQRGFSVPTNNAKGILENWVGVCEWLCKDDPPPPVKFQNAPPPLQKRLSHQHLWWPRANKFALFKS